MTVKSGIERSHQIMQREMDANNQNMKLYIKHTVEMMITSHSRDQMQDINNSLAVVKSDLRDSIKEVKSDIKDNINFNLQNTAALSRMMTHKNDDRLMHDKLADTRGSGQQ